ncbi:MAG: YetF domain-containing protein [Clostridia bacterium]
MEILKIIGLSVGSIIILFILTKIMGQREMSQLSIFDYFITITIGSIAAEMSTSLENNFIQPVVAMIVYAVITLIVSFLNTKFVKLRPILSGKTLILYDNGTLFKENFKKAKIDLNEFLVQCRTSGFFNLSDIKTALLEENGKISFLPYSDKRPSNPSDFNMKPKEDGIITNLILDGKIMKENLKELKVDKLWLMEMLQKQGIIKTDNIFLATYNTDGNLSVYLTNNTKDN